MSPVIFIEPLRSPERVAVLFGMNGFTTWSGNRIMLKSSMNGEARVESLSTPRAVMVRTESTISATSAISFPPGEFSTFTSRSKSPTRSRP